MNKDNLQRKSQVDDIASPNIEGLASVPGSVCNAAQRSPGKNVATSGVSIKDLSPQKKSKLIITMLRRLDKQHKLIVAHKEGNPSNISDEDVVKAKNVIKLLSSELDTVISSLSKRISKSQDVISSFDEFTQNALIQGAPVQDSPAQVKAPQRVHAVAELKNVKLDVFPSHIPAYEENDEDD